MVDDKSLMMNMIEILDDDKQNILSEVLKCVVCFELPKGKQVKICEEGHHFCSTCHKKMKACGICSVADEKLNQLVIGLYISRGNLLESRNFAVEQLVTKLGPLLGISKNGLPNPKAPAKLSPGSFGCLHSCKAKMPAFQMIPHLRAKHFFRLKENVRSNPYSNQFSFACAVPFDRGERQAFSVHVSDMGLFTVEAAFVESDFFGCLRVLGDETVASQFRYQLVVELPKQNSESRLEFSVTDCPASDYSSDIAAIRSEGKGLQVKASELFELAATGKPINIFFSVWRRNEKSGGGKHTKPFLMCLPEKHLFFQSDRNARRNRNRNTRRKRLKKMLANSSDSKGSGNSEIV